MIREKRKKRYGKKLARAMFYLKENKSMQNGGEWLTLELFPYGWTMSRG